MTDAATNATERDPHAPATDRDAVEGHVSGIVVNAVPERADAVAQRIAGLDGAEVAGRDGGRLVVVLEAEDEHGLADLVNRISLFEHVYSAALVSHYVDAPALDAEAEGET
jgi:nitrate reductase NapAB chaperone NapD